MNAGTNTGMRVQMTLHLHNLFANCKITHKRHPLPHRTYLLLLLIVQLELVLAALLGARLQLAILGSDRLVLRTRLAAKGGRVQIRGVDRRRLLLLLLVAVLVVLVCAPNVQRCQNE